MTTDSSTPGLQVTSRMLRDLEERLSEPLFLGMPVGPTLNNLLTIELLNGRGDWSRRATVENWLRRFLALARPAFAEDARAAFPEGRVLVTWMHPTPRVSGLVFPILSALGADQCLVLCPQACQVAKVPPGFTGLSWDEQVRPAWGEWWRAYRGSAGAWHQRLRKACRDFDWPYPVFNRLALSLQQSTQSMLGARELLQRLRPRAVLTEHDRNGLWSGLVLAARSLGVPTFTLVHGVLDEHATGYVPLLADRAFCWGELDWGRFLAAGEAPERLLPGGNPRLTPDLPLATGEARARLGLDPARPVIMLGTAPYPPQVCRKLTETFCQALRLAPQLAGVIRLHPSERPEDYAWVTREFPEVRVLDNAACSLDQALAAAEVVVVQDSGLGSDALVKGRLVAVLDVRDGPRGHGADLLAAGCPLARSPEELARVLVAMTTDDLERQRLRGAARGFVSSFCSAFGAEAAARIASTVLAARPPAARPRP